MIFFNIIKLLTPRERVRGIIVLTLMIIIALFEMVGVFSVAPFLAVMANQEIIQTNKILSSIYQFFHFESPKTFLMALGFTAIALQIINAFLQILSDYAIQRFSNMRRHRLSCSLLDLYLKQPYSFFLQRNSSSITKTMLSEVNMVITNALLPALELISYTITSTAIVVLLIIANPFLAMVLIGVLGGFYLVSYYTVRKLQRKLGIERRDANTMRFKIAAEILGGIKEVKVLGREDAYLKGFKEPSKISSKHQATSLVLTRIPKFLIKAFAASTILLIAIFMLDNERGSLQEILPLLGLYAVGGARLIPAFQKIYLGFSKIQFGAAAVDDVLDDLKGLEENQSESLAPCKETMHLRNTLELQDVTFTYEQTNEPALKDINLTIPANTTLGVIGTTGAGKSTLIDLILGLLRPDCGNILIDGTALTNNNLRCWQKTIGYVPQTIYLSDDTSTNNIAFGVPDKKVNREMVEKAAKMAQIHDFLASLPEGYDTRVGERGVRLSGGQRQRLGIARALYNNPDVLVLDEATNALDSVTETEVMKAVEALGGTKTIIMIAHRLSTVKKCDKIIKLELGEIVSYGNYSEVVGI